MLTLLCSRKIIMNNNNDQIIKAPYSTYLLDIFLYKFQHGNIHVPSLWVDVEKEMIDSPKFFNFPFDVKSVSHQNILSIIISRKPSL